MLDHHDGAIRPAQLADQQRGSLGLFIGEAGDRLVDEAALDAEVTALAATIAAQPPLAVQGAKRAVDASARLPVADGLVYEAEQQRECLRSADMREAIAALVEKRAPAYKGE